jgi:hypothetical protein
MYLEVKGSTENYGGPRAESREGMDLGSLPLDLGSGFFSGEVVSFFLLPRTS